MTKLPQIPGYRIIKKLGQGGMADVYLGVQEKLQRNVAIKVMVPSLFRDEIFSKRFMKEAQTAAQLVHPNIITIHDVGDIGDSHYIVMEYLEESLSNRLRRVGLLSPKESLIIVKMIAGALDYAHKKGFIHRDIKPDNIMFRSDGTVVLVDFGIARAIDSNTHLTRTGMSIGTPHYMSPEQCKGEKIDGRSDIYSLGVQLYEMMTGDVPYKAENTAGIIIKHIQDPVPRLPGQLSQYQPLLDKLMAKNRDQRIQSGGELIKFIDEFLTAPDFMPPAAKPGKLSSTWEEPTVRTPRSTFLPTGGITKPEIPKKKRVLPAAAVAAAIILAAFLTWFITRKPMDETDKTVSPLSQQEENIEKKPTGDRSTAGTGSQTGEEPGAGLDDDKTTDPNKTDIAKKEITPPREKDKADIAKKEITPPQEKLDNAGSTTGSSKVKPGEKDNTGSVPVEPVKTEPAAAVKKAPPIEIRTVNLLELDPTVLQTYNTGVQRIQIPILGSRLQVNGQVTLELFINEKGRFSIVSFNEMLNVMPPLRKNDVINSIKSKINNISLGAPRDKSGKPVRFRWRITFKVGKYLNRIILSKQ